MARKRKHEEHENHERWLVSYADFITLLFAFFVVMYAVSSVNEGKYRVLSESLSAAFRAPAKSIDPIQVGQMAKSPATEHIDFRLSPISIALPDLPAPRKQPKTREVSGEASKQAKAEQALRRISRQIETALEPMVKKELIHIRTTKYWVEVEINTSILFSSGSAALAPAALPVLRKVADILKPFPNTVQVEGFTDNVPIATEVFPSNWELSAARAASVVHLFTDAGIKPQRMVAIGYGEYRPAASNDTEQGRQRNRRVVVVVRSTAEAKHDEVKPGEVGDALAPVDLDTRTTAQPNAEEAAAPGDVQAGEGAVAAAVPDPQAAPASTFGPIAHFPVIAPPIELPVLQLGPRLGEPVAPPVSAPARTTP